MNYILTVDVAAKTISGQTAGCSDVVSVRGDKLADNVIFVFSENPEGFDLSADVKRIYYQLPGVPGVNTIVLTEVETANGQTRVWWPIESAITKVKGVVFFTLSIEKLNESGAITHSWNTLKNGLTIRESMVHTGAIQATNETIYEIQLAQISSLVSANTAEINALKASKQDVLTIDDSPSEGSTNPIASGAVFPLEQDVEALKAVVGEVEDATFMDGFSTLRVPFLDSGDILASLSDLMTGEKSLPEMGYITQRLRNGATELAAALNGIETTLALNGSMVAIGGAFGFAAGAVTTFYLPDGSTWKVAAQEEVADFIGNNTFAIYATVTI